MAEQQDNHWHLDKKVPIALIVAILAQTGSFIWWGATISQRVSNLEAASDSRALLSERITRQEALMEGLQRGVLRIEDKVDRLLDDR